MQCTGFGFGRYTVTGITIPLMVRLWCNAPTPYAGNFLIVGKGDFLANELIYINKLIAYGQLVLHQPFLQTTFHFSDMTLVLHAISSFQCLKIQKLCMREGGNKNICKFLVLCIA